MRRKLTAELLGTFGVSFATIALGASGKLQGGESSLLAIALAAGLAALAMIYTFGPISGAHFNPAVTLGFAVAGHFPWKQLPWYAAVQVCGATLATLATILIFGPGSHGVHLPAPHARAGSVLLLEALLSFFLMLVILAVATDPRAPAGFAGVAIGAVIVTLVLIGGPLSGASMNPARSLGPALLRGGDALAVVWLYLIGPCLGTAVAARTYALLRG